MSAAGSPRLAKHVLGSMKPRRLCLQRGLKRLSIVVSRQSSMSKQRLSSMPGRDPVASRRFDDLLQEASTKPVRPLLPLPRVGV